jgi:capsular polysaccharide export protein
MAMAEDFGASGNQLIQAAVNAELAYLRQLGANENLAFASANLGAFEALLIIIQNGEHGLPVYQAVANVRTPFSGPAGIINRLKTLRRLGLLEEKPGAKKSEVCLAPSEKLIRDICPVLFVGHYCGLQEGPPPPPPPTHTHTGEWLPARNERERQSYGRLSFNASLVVIGGKIMDAVRSISGGRISGHVEPVKPQSSLALVQSKPKNSILLLQGPVGPFFAELQEALSVASFTTRRVVFNAGDKLFTPERNYEYFTGTLCEWETWLRFEFAQNPPDAIVLFGSNRPAHKIARRLAELYRIDVLSLEEGYLRSGYVSCELGGNNKHSPMVKWRPKLLTPGGRADAAPSAGAQPSSFTTMSFWAAVYYLVRDLASKPSDTHLFHRQRERVVPLAMSWGIHLLRRIAAQITEYPARRALRRRPGYILVPLQVSSDSQLQAAARGWSTSRLIEASLMALRANPVGQRVVFKLHPLERESVASKRLIFRRAAKLGAHRRHIRVLHSGRMGELTKHSSGMVVINSTSAFSALHNGVPVLVLGDAIFRHDEIVTLGETEADISAFFKMRHAKSRLLIDEFIAELKSQSVIPGDFYVSRGRQIAIAGIVDKLKQQQRASCSQEEARG